MKISQIAKSYKNIKINTFLDFEDGNFCFYFFLSKNKKDKILSKEFY